MFLKTEEGLRGFKHWYLNIKLQTLLKLFIKYDVVKLEHQIFSRGDKKQQLKKNKLARTTKPFCVTRFVEHHRDTIETHLKNNQHVHKFITGYAEKKKMGNKLQHLKSNLESAMHILGVMGFLDILDEIVKVSKKLQDLKTTAYKTLTAFDKISECLTTMAEELW